MPDPVGERLVVIGIRGSDLLHATVAEHRELLVVDVRDADGRSVPHVPGLLAAVPEVVKDQVACRKWPSSALIRG